MILDGESGGPYHDWARTTPVLKSMLDQTSRFAVTVVTAPPPAGDFSTFQPDFARYRAIVLNYDAPDERWPAALKASFDAYVSGGGGVVAVHAANNAFPGWAAYNQMLGVGGWRGRTEKAGPTGSSVTVRSCRTRHRATRAATANVSRFWSPCAHQTIRS